MTTPNHYTITETLPAGAAVVLYRGVRKRDGAPVEIKALRAKSPVPRAIERLRQAGRERARIAPGGVPVWR